MGEQRPARIAVLAVVAAAVMLVLSTFGVEGPTVEAAKKKQKVKGLDSAIVACPSSVGRYKLDEVGASPEYHTQSCDYHHPKQSGWVNLDVAWHVDEPGERDECGSRQPVLARFEHFGGLAWRLESPTKRVSGRVQINDQTKVSMADAESQLRKLIAAAEPLAHPCVPVAPTGPSEGVSCPLVLPGDLVRTDWYRGEAPAVEALSDGRYLFKCTYVPAYSEEGGAMAVKLEWKGGDPGRIDLCNAGVDEYYHDTKHRLGYHPVSVRISSEFVERWGGQALADVLVAAASRQTQRCPDAPEGPAPYASATLPTPDLSAADATAPVTIDIVLGGGKDETPPATDTPIELPEDDQHLIVIGGPDGEVIREEFIGSGGIVTGYGPLVTDADGNWSVHATVKVDAVEIDEPVESAEEPTTDEPAAEAPEPAEEPSEVDADAPASVDSEPDESAEEPTTNEPAAEAPEPAEEPSEVDADAPASVDSEPEPIPPPELVGVPEGLATFVAELPPKGAGAVRDLADQVEGLRERVERPEKPDEGDFEWKVPAGDIGALREIAPDILTDVRPVSGSILVTAKIAGIKVKTYVTPVINDDTGLIEVRLSKFSGLAEHKVVKALLATLNGALHGRGRFDDISVTPEGLVVVFRRKVEE